MIESMKKTAGAVALGLAGMFVTAADAANVYLGHEYVVVTPSTPGMNWNEARAAAQALGAGWDLATVGTAGENTYIESLLPTSTFDRSHYWIGASDAATEGTWVWIDGTPWSFADWWGGEPNGSTVENYLAYDFRSGWAWNDVPLDIEAVHGGTYARGFVAERVVVPIPPAALLFLSAVLGLTLVARRHRRDGASGLTA